jgi:hypothetical protein
LAHILSRECYDFLSFCQSLVQFIRSEPIPGGIAVVEKESGAQVISANAGTLQETLGEKQIEFQDPVVINNHAFDINGCVL